MLITGCSSGIGADAAARLVKCGFLTFATVRKQSDVSALKQRCGHSALLHPLILDVTDGQHINAAVEAVKQRLQQDGRQLLGLVNNAGYHIKQHLAHGHLSHCPGLLNTLHSPRATCQRLICLLAPTLYCACSYANQCPVEVASLDMFRSQYEANVFGTVAVTQSFLPLLRQYATSASSSHSARLVFLSSVGGRFSAAGAGPYCSSKFAIEAIADSLRMELTHWNIDVCLVEPGAIATHFFHTADTHTEKRAEEARSALASGGLPAGSAVLDFYLAADRKRMAEVSKVPLESPSIVSDAIEAALLDSRPLARYNAAWTSLAVHLIRSVPSEVADFALGRLFR